MAVKGSSYFLITPSPPQFRVSSLQGQSSVDRLPRTPAVVVQSQGPLDEGDPSSPRTDLWGGFNISTLASSFPLAMYTEVSGIAGSYKKKPSKWIKNVDIRPATV